MESQAPYPSAWPPPLACRPGTPTRDSPRTPSCRGRSLRSEDTWPSCVQPPRGACPPTGPKGTGRPGGGGQTHRVGQAGSHRQQQRTDLHGALGPGQAPQPRCPGPLRLRQSTSRSRQTAHPVRPGPALPTPARLWCHLWVLSRGGQTSGLRPDPSWPSRRAAPRLRPQTPPRLSRVRPGLTGALLTCGQTWPGWPGACTRPA